jgi:hypothetical protein
VIPTRIALEGNLMKRHFLYRPAFRFAMIPVVFVLGAILFRWIVVHPSPISTHLLVIQPGDYPCDCIGGHVVIVDIDTNELVCHIEMKTNCELEIGFRNEGNQNRIYVHLSGREWSFPIRQSLQTIEKYFLGYDPRSKACCLTVLLVDCK